MNFLEEFLKPFNLISITVTLISIALAIIFFLLSQRKKIIAYIKSDKELRIFDNKVSSPKIRVLDETGELIKDNVYLLKATIWNAGNLPIEPSDVRKPLSLTISPCSKILDFDILYQPYQDVAVIRLEEDITTSDNPDTKIIRFLWDHLDPGFGATFQVIYAGTAETKAQVEGYIVGINKFLDGGKPIIERYITSKFLR
jgi:hypothetical protein